MVAASRFMLRWAGPAEERAMRMDSGGWLLRAERSLWTGRPVHARVTLADAGVALYLAVALVAVDPVTELRAVRDAERACQVIAEARWRMRDGESDVYSSPCHLDGPAVPGGITLAAGEDVLWTGRPAGIPWWFGGHDVYLTAFALTWLTFVTRIGVLAVQPGSAAVLIFLVPFALAGAVYPAAGP